MERGLGQRPRRRLKSAALWVPPELDAVAEEKILEALAYRDVFDRMTAGDDQETAHELVKVRGELAEVRAELDDLRSLVDTFKGIIREHSGRDFPDDPREQPGGEFVRLLAAHRADDAELG